MRRAPVRRVGQELASQLGFTVVVLIRQGSMWNNAISPEKPDSLQYYDSSQELQKLATSDDGPSSATGRPRLRGRGRGLPPAGADLACWRPRRDVRR